MPIKPLIKGYFCSDVEDLATWAPKSMESVHLPLQISIGKPGGDDADIFQVLVATPEAIRKRFGAAGQVRSGRHLLIVSDFNWKSLVAWCEAIVSGCAADDWNDVAARLGRHFHWEYEDYVQSD